jgi:hypothetical protein
MTMTPVEFVGSFNNQRVTGIDAERTVNCFEFRDALGKSPKSLIFTSGLVDLELNFNVTGGVRIQYVFKGLEYLVVGSKLFRRNPIGVLTTLGEFVNTSSGYVGVTANTYQIIFVDGVNGYIWDTLANTFSQITDQSFPVKPIDVTYLDGFFVVANGDTPFFQLSSFNQGMVWGPAANNFTMNFAVSHTQFIVGASTLSGGTSGTNNYRTGTPVQVSGTALPVTDPVLSTSATYYTIYVDASHINLAVSIENARAGIAIVFTTDGGIGTKIITSLGQLQRGSISSHPGNIVACRTLHRRLFLFSDYYTEVWENNGVGTNLPFRRNNSLLIEYGTPAVGTISLGFDLMIFLSQDRSGLGPVQIVTGTQPFPISNSSLDYQFAQYDLVQQISDCRAFLMKENGLIFYRMNFTAANHTYVYNVSMSNPENEKDKLWHEEEILNGDRHVAQTHSYFNGNNYVGHYSLPILYRIDSNACTNAGESIRRMRISRVISAPGLQRVRLDRFHLDLLQGNSSLSNDAFVTYALQTEDGFDLLTEDGDTLLLDQILRVSHPLKPYVYLSVSRDGGDTYGYTVKAPVGNIGQRTFRTVWRKLAPSKRGKGLVLKVEFYDPVRFVVLAAAASIAILPE